MTPATRLNFGPVRDAATVEAVVTAKLTAGEVITKGPSAARGDWDAPPPIPADWGSKINAYANGDDTGGEAGEEGAGGGAGSARAGMAAAEKPCAQCGTSGATQQCSRCKTVVYCSRECQVAHWNKKPGGHKGACTGLSKKLLRVVDAIAAARARKPAGGWLILRRMGYTKEENPNSMVGIGWGSFDGGADGGPPQMAMLGGFCFAPKRTYDAKMALRALASTANGAQGMVGDIKVDERSVCESLRPAFAAKGIAVHYYPPPSKEELEQIASMQRMQQMGMPAPFPGAFPGQ